MKKKKDSIKLERLDYFGLGLEPPNFVDIAIVEHFVILAWAGCRLDS